MSLAVAAATESEVVVDARLGSANLFWSDRILQRVAETARRVACLHILAKAFGEIAEDAAAESGGRRPPAALLPDESQHKRRPVELQAEAAFGNRQCAIFQRVGQKFVQAEREILGHLRTERQTGRAGNVEPGFEAVDCAVDEVEQAHAAAHRIGDRAVGGRHRLQAVDQTFLNDGFLDRAVARQAEAWMTVKRFWMR